MNNKGINVRDGMEFAVLTMGHKNWLHWYFKVFKNKH